MTVAEAKKELARKLVFGDAQQIKAIAILAAVDEAKSAILECDYSNEHLKCQLDDLWGCDCIEKWDDALNAGWVSILRAALQDAKAENADD